MSGGEEVSIGIESFKIYKKTHEISGKGEDEEGKFRIRGLILPKDYYRFMKTYPEKP